VPPPPPPPTRTTITTLPNTALPASALPVSNDAIQLSLEDAVATAMQRNLGLLVQRFDREQFHLDIAQALGIYDLGLNAQAYRTYDASPASSQLTGAQVLVTKQNNLNSSVNQLMPWGGVGSLSFDLFRQESNSSFSSINPVYTSNFDLGLVQPLLRNFGKTATERGIKIAQLNSRISRETFEQQVTTTLEQVEDAYWNLVEAKRQYGVAQEALALARELHHQNQVRVQVGTLAPLELVQSEAGIATRQEDIVTAQAAVQNAEDALRQLLHLEEGDLWDLAINPTTAPETPALALDLQEALATAMQSRPELRNEHLQLDLRQLDVAYYRNQMLPRLDLTAHYGYNGTGGTVIVRDGDGNVVQTINGGARDAVDQLRDRDFKTWRVQLDFAYPLQNRSARARYAIANVSLDQGRTQLAQLEESIRTEVRTAVRGVKTATQQIQSAGAARVLAEKNLEAERKRYEYGLSTSFQVLLIQQDLTSARSAVVAAIAGYRRALAEYYRATGRLLDAEGVELDDPLRVEHLDRFGWSIGTTP
jgi:outer membrane protein TolC